MDGLDGDPQNVFKGQEDPRPLAPNPPLSHGATEDLHPHAIHDTFLNNRYRHFKTKQNVEFYEIIQRNVLRSTKKVYRKYL